MKNSLLKNLLFLGAFLVLGFTQAQNVSGTVSDENGPLPGANVIIKGTSNGTTTDFDGNYTVSNVTPTDVLVFSYVGFVTKEVTVGNQTTINTTLAEDSALLDEVVVVGYGTQSRAEVTGAISSIGSDELTAIPVTNAEQAMQGRAAGVTVINSGSPGTAPVVRIRGLATVGDNNPLYVIDGVITGSLAGISPSDIESINILKDASTTAIYGSQGSNGVVMVTTKKGTRGKSTISFNAYTGFQTIKKRYDVLNVDQYLQYANDAWGIVPSSPAASAGVETDWQDEIFQTGLMQNYELSLSGGNENANYRFSGGVLDQDGAVLTTDFKRYSFRANSQFRTGKFEFGETMAVAFNNQTPEINNGGRSIIEHAIKSAPYLPVYNPDNLGGFQGPTNPLDGQDAENPVRILKLGNRINKTTAITGSIYGQFEIFEGLKLKSQVGLDYFTFNNNRFLPSYDDDSNGSQTHSQAFATITKNSGTGTTIIYTNSLNYEKTFADVHNFDFLLLAEKYENRFTSLNSSSRNAITNEVQQHTTDTPVITTNENETFRIGYLGRLNYNYDDKYILALSLRRDASSRFGSNNRWGWFPSVALGWNIAKESFLEDTSVSNLKLRGSWGVVGNDRIANYEFTTTLTSDFIYPIGDGGAIGYTSNGLANPNLKWEETTMINAGLDLGFLNDKVTASFEYYKNESDDLLMQRLTPVSLGFPKNFVTENVGSVETKGFEFTLGYNDFEGDFTWSANLNLGSSKNEVLSLGSLEEITGGNFDAIQVSRTTVGEPLFYFYGLVTDGVFQTQAEVDAVYTANPTQTIVQPGDIRFKDLNGDGDITAEDRTKIGNPYPDFTYGLNLTANYKQWDFNAFISGVQGNEIYNTNIFDLEGMERNFNAGTAVLDRWTGPGTSNSVPRAGGNPQNYSAASDRYIEDGSFTRLKNFSIGYTLNDKILNEQISSLRIYLSGQNLVTISDYSGLDPEVGQSPVFNGGNAATSNDIQGIDYGTYPQPISVLVGVQVTF